MNDFKLSKRVRILSKILGQKSALEIFGAQKLGAGVTGDVFSTKGAAVKVAKGKKDRKVLEHEANILKALGQNKSTPNLLGKGKNYLAMQKLEGGPLSKHLSRIKSDLVFAEYICRRTIEAIGSLHRKGVAQRDLHSNNIFITEDYKVKVIDFGQASNKYGDVYRETFFGTNTDPRMGALSLIGDIFQGTQSYKTYQNILKKHIEKICERKGADVKLLFTDYSSVEGDDDKEARYFDNFEMALYPISTDNSEVRDFYNDIDRSLKINTRNPSATRNIQSRFANLSTSKNTARRINRPYKISGVIPKAEEGGVFDGPKSGYLVELHGKEVVVPYDEFIELMKHGLSDASESKQTAPVQEPTSTVEEKPVPEIEKELVRNINHPKLYPELQHIQPRYMWGQIGLYDLEFKSDIDRAIYYSKFSKGDNQKSTGTKEAVREWIFAVTGLNSYDDYEELREYRDRIKEYILERVKAYPDENPIVVPPIYDGPFEFPTEDDYEEEYDEDESIIDDSFLDSIRDEEENDTEEIKEQAETAAEVLEQVINNKKRERATPKPSSYKTNKEIFEFMKSNFLKIQGELSSINDSIQNQNNLILANTQVLISALDTVESQDSLIVSKLDAILQAFNLQNEKAKQLADEAENAAAERALEEKRDAASTFGYKDLTNGKSIAGNILANIGEGLGKRAAKSVGRFLAKRLLPRRMRARARVARRGAKALTAAPKKLAGRASTKIISSLAKTSAGKKVAQTVGKQVAKRTAVKAGSKAGAKFLAKKIPGVSLLAGGIFAIERALKGDYLGAALELASGAAGTVPGWGTAGSIAIDAALTARDIKGGYEQGTKNVEPGTAILHGTELVLDKDKLNPFNDVGGAIVAATMNFVGGMGPAGASVAPLIRQMAGPLMKTFDVPNVIAQTPVGGNFPTIGPSLKKKKTKKEDSGVSSEYDDRYVEESFTDKLMSMLSDPINSLLKAIKNKITFDPNQIEDHEGVVGDLKGNIVNPMEEGELQDYGPAKFGADRPGRPGGHNGRDIIGPPGMKVVAALPGTVTQVLEVGELPGGGWSKRVDIQHANGIVTKYMHIHTSVKKGDKVKAGQKIGSLTEKDSISSVPHLHFELWVNGKPVDPDKPNNSMLKKAYKLKDIKAGKVAGLSIQQSSSPGAAGAPTGDFDVIIPLDHVKKENVNKIPDKRGGNTFKNASETGAAGREREHQDKAAAKVKANLESKGLKVKIITPEDFGNYEDYDNYIRQQSAKGTRVVPLHFDAAVGQGGTGFLTRTRAGDTQDAALARPIQQQLSQFQKANPDLGNLGPMDTKSNSTINRASSTPAALVEMGSMVAWEQKYGKNFTDSAAFGRLASGIAEGIYKGGGFENNIRPSESQRPKFQSLQGPDNKGGTKYLIVNQQAKPSAPPSAPSVEFVPLATGRWRTKNEYNAKTLEKLRIGLGN